MVKEHDSRGKQGVANDTASVAKFIEQRGVEDLREENTIYDQRDIIANQHGRHEIVGVAIEYFDGTLGGSSLVAIHLYPQSVAGYKGYLHA